MTALNVVVLIGSPTAIQQGSGLTNERSELDAIIERATGAVSIQTISFSADGPPGAHAHIQLPPPGSVSRTDRVLHALGAPALHRRLARFPLGRLINSLGPVDAGRVFWRSVRANPAARGALADAQIAIAADLPAVKTAWLALRSGRVSSAYYDHRAAVGLMLPRDK